MGNTLTLAYNKAQYQLDAYFKDPEAENYAKQVAAQKIQDESKEKRKALVSKSKSELEEKNRIAKAEAEDLAKRSAFSPPQTIAAKISKGIISTFISLILIGFILYGGKLEANKAIGYGVPMRIVSFIYGALFFFIVIPKSLYDIYWLKMTIPDYAPLPIWNYVPDGWAEQLFFGAFSYVEDANSKVARERVAQLYSDGFSGIISTPVTAAKSTAPTGPTGPSPIANSKPPSSPVASSTGPTVK
jgi:hypothetical protein